MQKSTLFKNTSLLDWILPLLVFFLLTRTPSDADLWWHLRAGKEMWESKQILLTDTFSYTRNGSLWVNAFWLSEILLYLAYLLGDFFGIALFVSLVGAATFSLLYSRIREKTPFASALLVILAATTAAPIWGPRPQILSFLLIAWLDQWLASPLRRKWRLLPLFALWANVHGGWFWGFLLLIAHIAGMFILSFFAPGQKEINVKEAWQLLGWTALSGLAVGLNPNGLSIWALPFQQVDVSLQIQEWLSPDFHRVDFHPFLWMIFLLLLAAPYAPKPLNYPQLFKTLGFAYLTFVAQRNIALFAITALPLLAEWLQPFLHQIIPWKSRPALHRELPPRLASSLNTTLILLLALAVLGNLYLVSQPKRVQENYPLGAVDWLRSHQPPGRLFNSYNWGGYLLWTLPEYPVFIDGRADLYGNDLIQQWHDVVNARSNALDILNGWDVNIVLLEPARPIIEVLKKNDWKVVYKDEKAIVLARP